MSKTSSEKQEILRVNTMLIRTASLREKASLSDSPLKALKTICKKIQSNKGSFRIKGDTVVGIDAAIF